MLLLSDVVRRMLAVQVPASVTDPRHRGALRSIRAFGEAKTAELPELVNMGALADAMHPRVVVHSIRPGVARTIAETDLHSLPGEPPRLLRGAWLLEARHAERGEVLFGSTVALGGYVVDGAIYLVGLDYPDGAMVERWAPVWGAEDLEEGVHVRRSVLVDDHEAQTAWTRDAARFAVVLGLLLDAEGTPIRREDEREKPRRGGARGPQTAEWITRHLTLGRSDETRQNATSSEGAAAPPPGAIAVEVPVRGHLKRQRYGEGRSQVRWIYVAQHSARRWIAPRPVRIVVGRRLH